MREDFRGVCVCVRTREQVNGQVGETSGAMQGEEHRWGRVWGAKAGDRFICQGVCMCVYKCPCIYIGVLPVQIVHQRQDWSDISPGLACTVSLLHCYASTPCQTLYSHLHRNKTTSHTQPTHYITTHNHSTLKSYYNKQNAQTLLPNCFFTSHTTVQLLYFKGPF